MVSKCESTLNPVKALHNVKWLSKDNDYFTYYLI